MTRIAIIGAGSVARSLGRGFARLPEADVVHGVRDPDDQRHGDLEAAALGEATQGADVVVLAIPSGALADALPQLELQPGQTVADATNAVRTPPPDGQATVGDHVASLLPDGVHLVKAFNTIGAEFLHDGTIDGTPLFLPVAGDTEAVETVLPLASALGFEAVSLGDRAAFGHVEAHAALWIHLAFAVDQGRDFGFAVHRR